MGVRFPIHRRKSYTSGSLPDKSIKDFFLYNSYKKNNILNDFYNGEENFFIYCVIDLKIIVRSIKDAVVSSQSIMYVANDIVLFCIVIVLWIYIPIRRSSVVIIVFFM